MENKKTNIVLAMLLVLTMGSVHTQANTCQKNRCVSWTSDSCGVWKAKKTDSCGNKYSQMNVNSCAKQASCSDQNTHNHHGNTVSIEHLKHKIKKLIKKVKYLDILNNVSINQSNIAHMTRLHKNLQALQAMLNKVETKFAKKIADFGTNMPEGKTLASKNAHPLKKFAANAKRKLAAAKKNMLAAAKKNNTAATETAAETEKA